MGKGGGGQTTSTTQSSTSAPPAYLSDAYKSILNQGQQVSQLPLQQYGGPLLAGFTPLQNGAFNNIAGAAGSWSPYMNSASNLINSATQPIWSQIPQYNQQNIDQFMSPYTNDVVNAAQNDMARANATQQQQESGRQVMGGAFGGSGAEAAKNNLAYSQAQGDASTLANLRNSAFNNGQQAFMNQQGLQLGAIASQNATALQGAGVDAGLGTQNLSDILSQAAAQGNAGTVQQGLVQQQLNIPYQQFQQQQAYPYQQLQYFTNLASGVSGGAGATTSGTGTVPGQPDNTFGNIVGAGISAAGLFSDERVKYDIKEVGKAKNGLPIYTFKYKGDATATTHMGFIAQDVEKKHPGAVGEVGGIKTVNYERAAKKDGGIVQRTHMANGGIAPSILMDPANSYIPQSGFIGAKLDAPGLMSIPGQSGSAPPSLESLMMSPGGQNGMAGLGNLWDDYSGHNAMGIGGGFDPIMNDVNALGNANSGIDAFSASMFGSGNGYASGGAVSTPSTPAQVPLNPKIADTSGTPVTPFDPVVPGTPVYAFNPLTAAGNAVTVPTAWDAIGGKNAGANAAPKPADTSANLSYMDFLKYMQANPGDMNLFGGSGGGPVRNYGPGSANSLANNMGPAFANARNLGSLAGTVGPNGMPYGGNLGAEYQQYLASNGKYGFKRGGIVAGRKGYAAGGAAGNRYRWNDATGTMEPDAGGSAGEGYREVSGPSGEVYEFPVGLPESTISRVISERKADKNPTYANGGIVGRKGYDIGGQVGGMSMMPSTMMSTPPPSYGMNTPMPGAAMMSAYGMIPPGAGTINPSTVAPPDAGAGPVLSSTGGAPGGAPGVSAQLSAPPPMNLPPPPTSPEDQISGQVDQARRDLAAAMAGNGIGAGGPGPAATPGNLNPAAAASIGSAAAPATAPDSGSGGGILGHIRGALQDPARAGMIMAGLSMMGQHGPNASTAGVISRGLASGISTYATVKGAQVSAEQKALEMAQNAEKFKDTYDASMERNKISEDANNKRLQGMEDRFQAMKDVQDMKDKANQFGNGGPNGIYDKSTGLGPDGKPASAGGADALITPENADLRGQDLIDSIPDSVKDSESIKDAAKAYMEGRGTKPTTRSQPYQKLGWQLAMHADPALNEATFPVRQKAMMAFSGSGPAAGVVSSINTMIHHGDSFDANLQKLGNRGSEWWNAVTNPIEGKSSDDFNALLKPVQEDMTALSAEAAKTYKGQGGVASDQEIKSWLGNLTQNMGPKASKATIDEMIGTLLKGKLDGMKEQWQQAFPGDESNHYLDPESLAILQKRGIPIPDYAQGPYTPVRPGGGSGPKAQPAQGPAAGQSAAPSQADLEHTAQKYNMTVDQVKAKLGIK